MDELLVLVYSNLVNSHRPQISTIDKVLNRYCKRKKIKGKKRDIFIWDTTTKTPEEIKKIVDAQISINLAEKKELSHNEIIKYIAMQAIKRKYIVHVGMTEQRKSRELKMISCNLSSFDLGLPANAFKIIREIDLIILKGTTILSAIEVITSISTFNKAINDRFRNLIETTPNLKISLLAIVSDEFIKKANVELCSPANIKSGLAKAVSLIQAGDIFEKGLFDKVVGIS